MPLMFRGIRGELWAVYTGGPSGFHLFTAGNGCFKTYKDQYRPNLAGLPTNAEKNGGGAVFDSSAKVSTESEIVPVASVFKLIMRVE